MRADKTDVHKADGEFHHGHDTKTITHDIKHVVLIADGIHCIKVLLDVSEACPAAAPHYACPHL